MPFWDRDRWRPIQEYYGGGAKAGLKRCIEALVETPYEELDRWDHASLREWMAQHTSDDGVYLVWEAISVLEQITFKPHEHSASENLYTRKLHYYQATDGGLLGVADGRLGGALEADGGRVLAASSSHRRPSTG